VTVVPVNLGPVANAGPYQTVSAGAGVTLDGKASTDPDGDPITFMWTQTAGLPVTLNNAGTAMPTWTAPDTAGSYTFELTVSDQAASSTATVHVMVTTNPILYIANFVGNSVVAHDISAPQNINGNFSPDAHLAGPQTLLNRPSDLIVDAGGALVASHVGGGRLESPEYDNAVSGELEISDINGNFTPSRNVEGTATLLGTPTSIAVNRANDLAFVAEVSSDQIFVYANASTAAFNGNLPPIRVIASAVLNDPFGVNFGADDHLYVANNGGNDVLVFADASNINGTVTPTASSTAPRSRTSMTSSLSRMTRCTWSMRRGRSTSLTAHRRLTVRCHRT